MTLHEWVTESLNSFKTVDSFRNKAEMTLHEWITDSLNLFKLLIHSETKLKWLFTNESLNHSIRSKLWILSETKLKWLFTNESLNHSIRSNCWFIQKQSWNDSSRMSHWITNSLNSFKLLIHSETKLKWLFTNESLNHSIRSNCWFIQKQSWNDSSRMNHWLTDSLNSFKLLIHSETKLKWLFTNESLNHSIRSNCWFIQKQSWNDSSRMNHWLTDSLNSFKLLIHSETKLKWLFTNESLNHWLTQFVQTADSFRNKAEMTLHEWVTESLNSFKLLIHSETKLKWLFTNESLNHWLTQFVQTADSFRNKAEMTSRMSHWITDSLNSFKLLIHSETKLKWLFANESLNHWLTQFVQNWIVSETKLKWLFTNESLNHWLTQFVQTADSFRNKAEMTLHEWVTESLTHSIRSNCWFIQKQSWNDSLRMSHWITQFIQNCGFFQKQSWNDSSRMNHWLTQFVQTANSFRNKAEMTLHEWVTESLTHSIHSNCWFIQKQSWNDSSRMSHWITDSLNSFKLLIHSETKLKWLFTNELLNHWLTQFVQTADSFRNKAEMTLHEWVTESLTHSIRSNCWFIQKQSWNDSSRMSHWITNSLNSFKLLIHSETKLKWLFTNESLNH